MPFLTLNGVTIPIAGDSGRTQTEELGGRVRSFDGTYLSHVRARKRMWNFDSPPLRMDDSTALFGLLMGLGDFWPYSSDLFSSKGVGADAVSDVLIRAQAADGVEVNGDYQYAGSVHVEDARTNLSDLRDTDGTADFVNYPARSVGANVSNQSNHYYVGSAGVYYTFSPPTGSIRWVEAFLGNKSGSTTWAASVYVKPLQDSGVTLRGILRNMTDGIDGTPVLVQCPGDVWTRIEVTGTANDAAAKDWCLRIEEENANDVTSQIAVDAFQLEARGWSGTYEDAATPVSASGTLRYPNPVGEDTGAVSVNLWTRGPYANYGGGATQGMAYLADSAASVANALCLQYSAGGIRFITTGDDQAVGDTLVHTYAWDGTWHMITVVVNKKPSETQSKKEIYVDGVLVESFDPADNTLPDPSAPASFFVGNLDGTQLFNGGIEAVTVAPYAMSANQIAGMYALTTTPVGAPRMVAEGDFTPRPFEIVEAEMGRESYLQFGDDSGTWQTNGKRLAFTLKRV